MATYITTKGIRVESSLTNQQVLDTLRSNPRVGNFGKDLVRKHQEYGGLSNDQWAWARQAGQRGRQPSGAGSVAATNLLQAAQRGRKPSGTHATPKGI